MSNKNKTIIISISSHHSHFKTRFEKFLKISRKKVLVQIKSEFYSVRLAISNFRVLMNFLLWHWKMNFDPYFYHRDICSAPYWSYIDPRSPGPLYGVTRGPAIYIFQCYKTILGLVGKFRHLILHIPTCNDFHIYNSINDEVKLHKIQSLS